MEIIEKKSRFIGYAAPVNTEDEAKAFIAKIAAEHKKARHIAFAYVLSNTAKTNDDGEPKGTAGLPIYNVINRRVLKNVVVVVVRYFGGILLGKGGLIRAYGKAARLAIEDFLEKNEKELSNQPTKRQPNQHNTAYP
ncbi:MAG: YigZ family protein [Defluviitaleaceae bacterium]|nr:YigZ family protein [Defluviitaleaceae bacterium]